jgi:hypothetical protein
MAKNQSKKPPKRKLTIGARERLAQCARQITQAVHESQSKAGRAVSEDELRPWNEMSEQDREIYRKAGEIIHERAQKGIRASLRRHDRIIIFIGSTVVLLTYLIKEEWRESAKDAVADVDTKISRLSLDRELSGIHRDIHLGDERFEEIEKKHATTKSGDSDGSATYNGQKVSDQLVREYDSLEDQVGHFYCLSWLDRKESDELLYILQGFGGNYADTFKNAADIFATNLDNFQTLVIEEPLNPHDRVRYIREEELPNLTAAIDKLESSMVATILSVDKDLKKQKEDAEARYNTFWYWSLGLYGFGWLLALVGQLFGIRGLGNEG